LAKIYPEHRWIIWKFKQAPRKWFIRTLGKADNGDKSAVAVLKEFIESIATDMGLETADSPEQWAALLDQNPNLHDELRSFGVDQDIEWDRVLSVVYPEHNWKDVKIFRKEKRSIPKLIGDGEIAVGYWQSIDNQRQFLLRLAEALDGSLDSLQSLTTMDIAKAGGTGLGGGGGGGGGGLSADLTLLGLLGSGLISYYNGSMEKALTTLLPNHQWATWRFPKTPQRWWRTLAAKYQERQPEAMQTMKRMMDDIAQHNNIVQLADWYKFQKSTSSLSPQFLHRLNQLGGLVSILTKVYPLHNWDKSKFIMPGPVNPAVQRALKSHTAHLLPKTAVKAGM